MDPRSAPQAEPSPWFLMAGGQMIDVKTILDDREPYKVVQAFVNIIKKYCGIPGGGSGWHYLRAGSYKILILTQQGVPTAFELRKKV